MIRKSSGSWKVEKICTYVNKITQLTGLKLPCKNKKKITICFLDKQVALLNSWKLFPTARALIGYFEVTWHLTTKLFPAKISERATMQSLWRQRVTVHCYPRMLSARKIYFHKFVHKKVFLRGLYNRSLKDWSLRKQFIFPLESQCPQGNKTNCLPRDHSLSVYYTHYLGLVLGSLNKDVS